MLLDAELRAPQDSCIRQSANELRSRKGADSRQAYDVVSRLSLPLIATLWLTLPHPATPCLTLPHPAVLWYCLTASENTPSANSTRSTRGRRISASPAPFIRIALAMVTKWRTGLNSAATCTQ